MSNPWWLGGRERSRMYDAIVLYMPRSYIATVPLETLARPLPIEGRFFMQICPLDRW